VTRESFTNFVQYSEQFADVFKKLAYEMAIRENTSKLAQAQKEKIILGEEEKETSARPADLLQIQQSESSP